MITEIRSYGHPKTAVEEFTLRPNEKLVAAKVRTHTWLTVEIQFLIANFSGILKNLENEIPTAPAASKPAIEATKEFPPDISGNAFPKRGKKGVQKNRAGAQATSNILIESGAKLTKKKRGRPPTKAMQTQAQA